MIRTVLGEALAFARTQPTGFFDAVVTDPPYALGFMGHDWDRTLPGPELWREVLRICKPGAHLVACGGTRTWHRLACSIEDGGWEIRDSLQWLYGTGFPKSKACLKPGVEPIVLARAPGARTELNIDACRLGPGRYPANVLLDEEAAALLDEQSGVLVSGAVTRTYTDVLVERSPALGAKRRNLSPDKVFADSGGASRFFYCAKASKSERTHGRLVENPHSTVKPLSLMRWLVRLVSAPGAHVLDLFAGSGTTGLACLLEGRQGVLVERDPTFHAVVNMRLAHASYFAEGSEP